MENNLKSGRHQADAQKKGFVKPKEKKEWAIEKAQDLCAKLDSLLSESLIDTEKIKALVNHYRINGLYQYSFINSVMICAQGGQLAQSFKRWLDLERHVRKGEKARIYIFTPAFKKKENEETGEKEEFLAYFLLKPIFDVSQTEGKPLEYVHNSADTAAFSFDDLAHKVSALTGLQVIVKPTGQARGFCDDKEIAISESSNNTDRIKTLFHEAAHALFNHHKTHDRPREVEAEAAAYLLLSFLGIDYELSAGYINGWKADRDQIAKTEIIKVADRLIRAVRPVPEPVEALALATAAA